jgi:hypothetical protein
MRRSSTALEAQQGAGGIGRRPGEQGAFAPALIAPVSADDEGLAAVRQRQGRGAVEKIESAGSELDSGSADANLIP